MTNSELFYVLERDCPSMVTTQPGRVFIYGGEGDGDWHPSPGLSFPRVQYIHQNPSPCEVFPVLHMYIGVADCVLCLCWLVVQYAYR